MKYICFELSMPNVGSWNGKWTGEKNLYAIIRKYRDKKVPIFQDSYYYNFGDGWGASVSIREVDGAESRKIKKKSKGFYGYEWMIDSIVDYGKILNSQQIKELNEKV